MKFNSFSEFYPYYLAEHSDKRCRVMHYIGSTGVLILLFLAFALPNYWLLIAVPLMGYGFAWLGHFGFEKNKPATFKYPLYSFLGDWVMYKDGWVYLFTGKRSQASEKAKNMALD